MAVDHTTSGRSRFFGISRTCISNKSIGKFFSDAKYFRDKYNNKSEQLESHIPVVYIGIADRHNGGFISRFCHFVIYTRSNFKGQILGEVKIQF